MMTHKRVTKTKKQRFANEIKACQEALLNYIAYHVRSLDDVDGRVDDTLLAAYEAYPDFQEDSRFKTWLYHIADHQIALYYRQQAAQIECLRTHDDVYELALASNQPGPDKQYELEIEIKSVMRAIGKLSCNQQCVLEWHALDGLSHAEIGRRLCMNKQAVRKILSRARKCLSRILQNRDQNETS